MIQRGPMVLCACLVAGAAVASCSGPAPARHDGDADVPADGREETGEEPALDAPDDVSIDPGPETGDPSPDPEQDVPADEVVEGDAYERGECTSSADCGGRACVRVPDEPGGYWLCKVAERTEALDCSSTDPWVDQCCMSSECLAGENGGCFYSDWGWGFCGGGLMPHNVCLYDECGDASDCTRSSPAVCVPRDIQDWPRRRCAYGSCRTSLDCTREPGGYCAPLFDFCCDYRISGLFCIYPGACHHHTDCSGDLMGCVGDPATGGTMCELIHCPL